MFSRDGLTNWSVSDVEPFSFNISYEDGSHGLVATRERPKLLFDAVSKEPTHIYSATVDLPTTSCTTCDAKPPAGACIMCKITKPYDQGVYTMVRPLRTKNDSATALKTDDGRSIESPAWCPWRRCTAVGVAEHLAMMAAYDEGTPKAASARQ
jgi:hypothetical protein